MPSHLKNLQPLKSALAITPADATPFTGGAIDGLWVGGVGNVTCQMNGATVLFTAVPAGTLLPFRIEGVDATATTATLMVGLRQSS